VTCSGDRGLLRVFLLQQCPLHPAVNLLPILALKPDPLTGLNKPADLFRDQLLGFVHTDVQSPACLNLLALIVV
jgi:hypothetical protein